MTATAIFSAIVGVIKAIPIVDSWFKQFLAWYMQSQTGETLSQISDAAAYSARAKTDEDRYVAARMWSNALSHDRFVS